MGCQNGLRSNKSILKTQSLVSFWFTYCLNFLIKLFSMFQTMTHFVILLTAACFFKLTVCAETSCFIECKDSEFCYDGVCKPKPAPKPCSSEKPKCPFVENCEKNGECKVKKIYNDDCESNAECKYGFVCIDAKCISGREVLTFPDCVNSKCPKGFECGKVKKGQCYPKKNELEKLTKCYRTDKSCPDGKECQYFHCIPKVVPGKQEEQGKTKTTKEPENKKDPGQPGKQEDQGKTKTTKEPENQKDPGQPGQPEKPEKQEKPEKPGKPGKQKEPGKPKPEAGAACKTYTDCADFSGAGKNGTCVNETCHAKPRQSCSKENAKKNCAFFEKCLTETKTCVPKTITSCTPKKTCPYGFACADGQCLLARKILAFPNPKCKDNKNCIGSDKCIKRVGCFPANVKTLKECSKDSDCGTGKQGRAMICQYGFCVEKYGVTANTTTAHATTEEIASTATTTITEKPDVKTTTTTNPTTTTTEKPDVKKTTKARVTKKPNKKPHKKNECPTFCGYPKFMVTAVFVSWFLGK